MVEAIMLINKKGGNIMELKEILTIMRNIHYKCFLVGLIFLIIAAVLYLPCKCYVANLYQVHFGISTVAYYNMWALFVGLIKTILIFLFLVPGLAIHWVLNEYNKKHPGEK